MRIKDAGGRISTGDPNLACALLTAGIPLDFDDPVERVKGPRGDFLRFHFREKSLDGTTATAELAAAWSANSAKVNDLSPSQVTDLSDDVMGHCMAFSKNRVELLKLIHECEPLLMVRRGKQVALVSERASQVHIDNFLGKIK